MKRELGRTVRLGGEEIELTKAQYDRLQDGFGDYLVRVCTKEEIELIKSKAYGKGKIDGCIFTLTWAVVGLILFIIILP